MSDVQHRARAWLPALAAMLAHASAACAADAFFEVRFRDQPIATQLVSRVDRGGVITVETSFEATMPVFVAQHRYREELSVTFRASDGTVEACRAVRQDGNRRTDVSGQAAEDGSLVLVRRDLDGATTNRILRAMYDTHSLALYALPPAEFLPTNQPVRVLDIARGEVVPTEIETISETRTFERQVVPATHLVWRERNHTSHSWHTDRFSALPDPYIRQTEDGDFEFRLLPGMR